MPRMNTISWGTFCWWGSRAKAPVHCVPMVNIYHCRLQPEMGGGWWWGVPGVWKQNRDTQEVILQGYIQGPSINNCLKMAAGWWGLGGGYISGDWRWHEWWFGAAGRAISTWQQCNEIIRAIRANKNPWNLPQNPDYDRACCLNTKQSWEGLTGYKICSAKAVDFTSSNTKGICKEIEN